MDPAEIMYQKALTLQQPMLDAAAQGDSDIQQFYNDTTILVTGGTGFLGKVLIEKLIRSCKPKKIYILIRSKQGKHLSERLDMFLKDSVFDTIRKKQPDFGQIIVPLEGDIMELGLGMSDQDCSGIIQTVDFIFHLAATIKFDEVLSKATLTNVRGTREVIALAKQCKKFKCLVHVSTAFSHATRSRVDSEILEEFYRSPIAPDALIGMAESMEDERLNAVTEKLINDWPNTYTFTKAVAEEMVRSRAGELPACVVRPPIVMPSYLEPSPGWAEASCLRGLLGLIAGGLLGIIHVYIMKSIIVNLVPVDFVANALIASAYETKKEHDREKHIKIYTLSSRDKFSKTELVNTYRCDQARALSSPQCVWYSCGYETNNKFFHWVLTWLFHTIPAYILDAVLFLLRLKKPHGISSFANLYEKIYSSSLILSYFAVNEWKWRDDNTAEMYRKMSRTDKSLFNFHFTSVDITEVVFIWILGVRKYIIKDGLKNTAIGTKKQFFFKIATCVILFVYAYLMWIIIHFVYKAGNIAVS